jgi:hypothetical protein
VFTERLLEHVYNFLNETARYRKAKISEPKALKIKSHILGDGRYDYLHIWDRNRVVYGRLRRMGWKPKRERRI